jgi:predicted NBD/HSP70 family sugar kinase
MATQRATSSAPGRAGPPAASAPPGSVNHGLLRELSEQAVLESVFRHGPISRAQIAELTGLSKPTVSQAMARLEREGLVHQSGQRRGMPGRVATLYSVDRQVGFVIGVDVGGTRVRGAVANIYGEILREDQRTTDRRGGRHVLRQMGNLARRLAAATGIDWSLVAGVGVATPGVVDPSSGRIHLATNIPSWEELQIEPALGQAFGVPVQVGNNVNLAAVGEKWRGLAKDVSTFAYLAVGVGVGMGLVLNNELFVGARGAAGEIAYLPLAPDSLDPRHRSHGALEDVAGGSAIVTAVRSAAGWDRPQPTSAEEVFALAREGYEPALRVVAEEGRRIGLAVASACAVIDPELVVLGGGIGGNPLLLGPTRATASALIPLPPRIESSLLGDRAALYGAVAVALRAARDSLLWGGRTA